MPDKNDYVKIRLITGAMVVMQRKNLIGFCHYPVHRGGVTKALLKSHKCISKGCKFLQKYEDIPYWEAAEQIDASKKKMKTMKKQLKNEAEQRELAWVQTAQGIADDLDYCLKVVQITKLPKKDHYVLYYVSEYAEDDWYKYLDLAKGFGKVIGGWVELKHVKDVDGSYAVL